MDLLQSNKIFWDVLESDICAIPNYIKNILMFCNFGNVLSLQKFDDYDIIEIEKMAKDQFKPWLDENLNTTNLVDYFGPIYHTKPDQFTFTCGDKKMMQQISEYVKSTVQKKGYGYFQGKNSRCPQNVKQHAVDHCEVSEEELQEKLFNGVLILLQPYGDHVTSLFKKEMALVTNENGEIKGVVHCVICDIDAGTEKQTKKRRKNHYSQYWNGQKWIVSNFANHHLNKVHPIANYVNKAPEECDIDKQNRHSKTIHPVLQVDGTINEGIVDQSKGSSLVSLKNEPSYIVQHSNLSENVDATENYFGDKSSIDELKTDHLNLPTDDLRKHDLNADNFMTGEYIIDETGDTSLVALEIEPLHDEFSEQVKILRARLQMHNIRLINNAFQSRDERSECEIQLSNGIYSKIEVCHITADGNCLFGATVHQRFFLEINSDEYIQKVAELRKEVVNHIKNNFSQYERLLIGRVYAKSSNNDTETDIENTEERAKKFLDDYLSKEKTWAGPETIQAISEIYAANVVIFNEWGEVYCGNSFNSSYEDFITLAFRVSKKHTEKKNVANTERDHYDSVIKMTNDVLDKCASILLVNHEKSSSVKTISDVIDIE